jgi:soluble lytic murein transglycosylase-like protein
MFHIRQIAVVGLALWMCVAWAEEGKIYKYIEKDGTIVYTNTPRGRDKVPPSSTPRAAPPVMGAQNAALQAKYQPFEEMVLANAQKYKLPAALLKAVMHVESAFEPAAVSPKGSMGLMQLMPGTAQQLAVEDALNAKANIEGGARYLRMLSNLFDGDMVQVLAAYNAGPDAVKKYGGQIPPYPETQLYVRKVLSLYFVYQYPTQLKEKEP